LAINLFLDITGPEGGRLYILDEDRDAPEEPKREIYYNFPEEFVSKGEIKLNQQPVIARFKLIPVSSTEASKGPSG